MCCVLGQVTLFTECLSLLWSINEYRRIADEMLMKCCGGGGGGVNLDME